jgi:alpha-1,2-mannosyltransferase
MYPHFTLILQSLGSMILGFEALIKYNPDIFIDTMGYSFTYPIAKLFGCKVGCYVHYPIISTDMLSKVKNREVSFNNEKNVSQSNIKTNLKLIYYNLFSYLYGIMGYFADSVMVNSTWTYGHIKDIWWNKNIKVVFPPVDVNLFSKIQIGNKRKLQIVSIGQFRPEKDHPLQIKSFNKFIKENKKYEDAELVLIGGCRDSEDGKRVEKLKMLVQEYQIENNVKFVLNAKIEEIIEYCSSSIIGLHCMNLEHFGICIVEYMASGLIVLANNSGGPKMDVFFF